MVSTLRRVLRRMFEWMERTGIRRSKVVIVICPLHNPDAHARHVSMGRGPTTPASFSKKARDLALSYAFVVVKLMTHSAKGVTERDFALAQKDIVRHRLVQNIVQAYKKKAKAK